jgi:prepilin-type N-terminal cleavage/methylation domain-containing protein
MSAPRRNRSQGFTLLELMIAMAITALVMGMVGGILVSTLEADEHVNQSLKTEKTGYGILQLIRRDLESCYSYGLGGPAFKGDNSGSGRLSFVSATAGQPDPETGLTPMLQRIGYKLQSSGTSGLSLFRQAEPYTTGDPLQAGTFALVATGIKSLQFSYLDPKDKSWKPSQWAETDRVPLAVKIDIELAPNSQQTASSSSFGLNGGAKFSAVVGLPTYFAPLPDAPAQPGTPGAPGTPPPPPGH